MAADRLWWPLSAYGYALMWTTWFAGVAALARQAVTSQGNSQGEKKHSSHTKAWIRWMTRESVFLQRLLKSVCPCGLQGQRCTWGSVRCCSAPWSPTPAWCGATGGSGTKRTWVRLQTPGPWCPVTATPSRRCRRTTREATGAKRSSRGLTAALWFSSVRPLSSLCQVEADEIKPFFVCVCFSGSNCGYVMVQCGRPLST